MTKLITPTALIETRTTSNYEEFTLKESIIEAMIVYKGIGWGFVLPPYLILRTLYQKRSTAVVCLICRNSSLTGNTLKFYPESMHFFPVNSFSFFFTCAHPQGSRVDKR